MTEIFQVFTEIVTWAISAMTSMLTFIISQPYILVPMMVFFISGGVIALLLRIWRS